MARKSSPQYNITSYQKKSNFLPFLIWAIAAIIFGCGVVLLVVSLTGNNGGGSVLGNLFPSATPTATETFTPTPTVPTSTPTMTATATETPLPTNTPTPEGPQTYTIQEGDNCYSIISEFGVGLDIFLAINNLDANCWISPGQEVVIPAPGQELPTETPFPLDEYTSGQQIEYTVQTNDTYYTIASKFNTTLASIAKLNNIENIEENIFPQIGMPLTIKVNLVTPTPTAVPTYTEVPSGN